MFLSSHDLANEFVPCPLCCRRKMGVSASLLVTLVKNGIRENLLLKAGGVKKPVAYPHEKGFHKIILLK